MSLARAGRGSRGMRLVLLVLLIPIAAALGGCQEKRTIRRVDIHQATPTPEVGRHASEGPSDTDAGPAEDGDPAPIEADGDQDVAGGP